MKKIIKSIKKYKNELSSWYHRMCGHNEMEYIIKKYCTTPHDTYYLTPID